METPHVGQGTETDCLDDMPLARIGKGCNKNIMQICSNWNTVGQFEF